jgi:hypothetical protein
MSEAYTSLGTELAVSVSAPATYNEAGYEALTFTDVGEITSVGEFGPTAAVVTHDPLALGYTVKRKGQINYGSLTLQMARDITDDGQVILKAGADGSTKYTVHTWRVTHQSGLVQYFTGMVFGYTTNVGGSNQIVGASTTIELDRPILDVAP